MKPKYLSLLAVCACLALSGCSNWLGSDAQKQALQANSPTALEQSPLASPQNEGEWLQYQSKIGGYSFAYPPIYSVVEMERGFIQLRVNGEITDGTIALYYVMYQMDDLTDDLLNWAEAMGKHHVLDPMVVEYFPASFGKTDGSDSRQIYLENKAGSAIPFQSYWITNGRLVLQVSANFQKDENKAVLEGIARSVKFSDDAPTDMSQLYAPDAPPSIATLAEFLELMQEKDEVSQALNIWAATGETPVELVEQMSERARADYERTVELQSRIQRELDERAGLETPSAPADMQPEGGPFTYTVTSTTTFAPESPLFQPMPPSPVRESTGGYYIYQEKSAYGDEFTVRYPSEVWKYSFEETNRKLKHQAIAGCELWLNEGPRGNSEESIVTEIEAGDNTWIRGIFPIARRGIYGADVDSKYYLFGVTYAESTTEAELEQCLAEAEAVIATFEPVE